MSLTGSVLNVGMKLKTASKRTERNAMPRKRRVPTKHMPKSSIDDEYYAGFDLSLTGTGVCVVNRDGKVVFACTLKNNLRGEERLVFIREALRDILREFKPKMICVEDYAYAATYGGAFAGEVGGTVKVMMYEEGFQFYKVAPTRLKKFINGGGGAKNMIILNVFKSWGYTADDDNQADACGLAQMARATCVRPIKLTKPRMEAVRDTIHPPPKKKKKGAKKDESEQ